MKLKKNIIRGCYFINSDVEFPLQTPSLDARVGDSNASNIAIASQALQTPRRVAAVETGGVKGRAD